MTRKEGLVPKISNGSFRYLMENDGYYVDKTSVIKTLFAKEAEQIQLIARPRRFGKSLTLSMLYSFFTCVVDGKEVKGDTSWHRKLFSGLRITGDEDYCREHMGQYPVIYLNFKDICTENFTETRSKFCSLIVDTAFGFSFVMDRLDAHRRKNFEKLLDFEYLSQHQGTLENALRDLTDILNSAFQKKVIILIDEYDVPLQKANMFGYYDKMVIIIRNMLSAALKDEGNNQEQKLFRAILTGCFRASKESIFTGLNNLSVDTVVSSSEDLAAAIGFTDEEVTEMLDYFGLGDMGDTVREFYDGYRIGGVAIYCAWSVMAFCEDNYLERTNETPVYWINTSGNDVINDFLGYLTPDDAEKMEILLNGGTVDIPVNETMSYQELKNRKSNDFWSLLLYTGYLTSVSKKAGGDSDSLAPVIGASPPFFPPFRLFGGMPSHITYTPFPSFSNFIPVLPLLRPPFLKKNVFRMLFFVRMRATVNSDTLCAVNYSDTVLSRVQLFWMFRAGVSSFVIGIVKLPDGRVCNGMGLYD